jgi:LPXTG-site transpeptidase (sortase) family protein
MEIGAWMRKGQKPASSLPAVTRTTVGRQFSNVLILLGALCLVAAISYGLYAMLNTWLIGQSRFLVAHDIASLPVPAMTWTPSPTPTASPQPTQSPTPTPIPSPTPTPTPRPPSPPVQIRIPALGVKRSIVSLPRVRDKRTGAWTWNTNRLFRSGRSDVVGHWEGSASPGQNGNMILVGHNYGYGYNGVFVNLVRIKPGQKVYVVNRAGQTFTYQVKTVKRLRWRQKSFGELTQHLSFLAPGGSERLTLVSCAGADFEPFPERVYVVAVPVGR